MNKKLMALLPLAAIVIASGCVSSLTNPLCNNECRETTRTMEGDIGEVSTIDTITCRPHVNEECRILSAHWSNIEPRSMEGEYVIRCECCKIVSP